MLTNTIHGELLWRSRRRETARYTPPAFSTPKHNKPEIKETPNVSSYRRRRSHGDLRTAFGVNCELDVFINNNVTLAGDVARLPPPSLARWRHWSCCYGVTTCYICYKSSSVPSIVPCHCPTDREFLDPGILPWISFAHRKSNAITEGRTVQQSIYNN